MAGIYIHIPYCKQACHYCNFHFSTSTDSLGEMIDAINHELQYRKLYLNHEHIDSIYFGGGTPSMVPSTLLQKILGQIFDLFLINEKCEITIEANPDDIDSNTIKEWVNLGINRLSLGVQSFHDDDLFFMNRAHSVREALDAMSIISNSAIQRITADIIFGFEGLTNEKLLYNLSQLYKSRINHISCYAMTVEPKTALHYQIKTGKVKAIDDHVSSSQFKLIKSVLESEEYDHYEISNYARKQEHAIHNTNYWKNKPYLGVGPSAHSFNGITREWNIANNNKYLALVKNGESISEVEILSNKDHYNEYIMTGLRTKWGIDIRKIEILGAGFLQNFRNESKSLLEDGTLVQRGSTFHINDDHLIFCDSISSKLFYL